MGVASTVVTADIPRMEDTTLATEADMEATEAIMDGEDECRNALMNCFLSKKPNYLYLIMLYFDVKH